MEKDPSSEPPAGFRDLWRTGLALIQNLAGDRWTDYNAHDPGVTILEQVCYALTESIYKSNFPVGDYLAAPEGVTTGKIDHEKQALYPPEQILPCRPVTPDDYREAIFDAVPQIDDIHLDPASSGGLPGLYTIRVRLTPRPDDHTAVDPQAVIEKVKAAYRGHRNLCEDIAAVHIVKPALCRIKGRIEIDGRRDPNDLLAEIYFRCSRFISPGISVVDYDRAIKEGRSLETIFTGPLIRCGHIGRRELKAHHQPITLADIFGVIRAIDGVVGIQRLTLLDAAGNPMVVLPQQHSETAASLAIPGRNEEMGIALVKKSKTYPVSARSFRSKFDRLEFNLRAYKNLQQDFSALYDPPPAMYRPLKTYTAIGNHFPRIYGIDRYGVPASAGPERVAQARQLKGYLLFFDQIMADFNAQLSNIGPLFSNDPALDRTYFHQVLDDDSVPQVADLLADRAENLAHRQAAIMARRDDYGRRRGRVLDYLLALYGEQFTQKYMRHFHYYIPPTEITRTIIENKIRLLKHLPAAGHHRGGAVDYSHMAWQSREMTGFELKVRILLGLPCLHHRSLSAALAAHGLKLVSDSRFRQMLQGGLSIPYVDLSDVRVRPTEHFHDVPPDPKPTPITPDLVEKLHQNFMLLQRQVVNASFFRQGIQHARYQIGPLTTHGGFQVIFKPFDEEQWCYLATYAQRAEAIRDANNFCRLLLHLNQESEGLHIIEHILLRPLAAARHKEVQVSDDFYPFRISVLMPAWTARFHDDAFRRLAEDTLRINCPAHVAIRVHWLEYDQMHAFELIYRQWLTAKSDHPDGSPALDALSAQLIRLLLALDALADAIAPGDPAESMDSSEQTDGG
ncbi:MAG: hypothetical protein HKP58_04355 [Desulfatitalea sp.]|nr:hypothetical protein [Desulfatitalea sp.]NNJ99623.1 hypothetical protein [Desulfatitalea sp.]